MMLPFCKKLSEKCRNELEKTLDKIGCMLYWLSNESRGNNPYVYLANLRFKWMHETKVFFVYQKNEDNSESVLGVYSPSCKW
jgi:hypothetical protein